MFAIALVSLLYLHKEIDNIFCVSEIYNNTIKLPIYYDL